VRYGDKGKCMRGSRRQLTTRMITRFLPVAALLILVLFIGFVPSTFAADSSRVCNQGQQDPEAVVKACVDQVIAIVSDPSMKVEEKAEERKARLRALFRDLFDFDMISKRVLGRYWRKFSPEEFKEFQELFSKMLEKVYLTKIENYSGEKVVYEAAKQVGRDKYLVNTKIITEDLEIPVAYRLKKRGDRWVGYDVIVEGVSLVKNYRSQFQQILRKKSPEELLAFMRGKVQNLGQQQMGTEPVRG